VINTSTGAVAQRVDYDEFGNVTQDTAPGFQPLGFAGGLYDSHTGFKRFGARDYDAQVGRWTAKDPIGYASRTLNLYAYGLGDPVNLIDPSGLEPLPACAKDFLKPFFPSLDLDQINIHPDGVPFPINLNSDVEGFTFGNDLYFRQGSGNPYTVSGLALIGHELRRSQQYQESNGFAPSYLWQQITKGYSENQYEQEAYGLQAVIREILIQRGGSTCFVCEVNE